MLSGLGSVEVFAQDYFRDVIAPIFVENCLSCHNEQNHQGDFSLQTAKAFFAGGYVDRGTAESSHLIDLVTAIDGKAEMPDEGNALSDKQVVALRKWIDSGAAWPAGFRLEDRGVRDFSWWSFQPLGNFPIPPSNRKWGDRNQVDAFISKELEAQGLRPSAEADRRTLIRRLTLDLHGLPPTSEEVEAFLADQRADAYEKLVERLLASPRYGERWARHWLDVVQYADTCGYDKDKLRPHAWPYRDYVIESLNHDKPWGRFIEEQIAGDVLYPNSADGIVGLGFIAAGPWDFIGHVEVPESKVDGKVARNLDRDNMVANTFNAFCSLTVQCARCHHHKHDPITQEQYYGLQAIFAAVDRADRSFDADPKISTLRRDLKKEVAELLKANQAIEDEITSEGGEDLEVLRQQLAKAQEKLTQAKVEKTQQFGFHSQISESQSAHKWVNLELATEVELRQVVLHPCHDDFGNIGAGFGFPVRFKIEVSSDGKKWETLLDQTQSDFANPGLKPVSASHTGEQPVTQVRITATSLSPRSGDFIFALAEVELLDSKGRNVAPNATVTSLDSIEMPKRWSRDNLVDEDWPRWQNDPRRSQEDLDRLTARRDQMLATLETPERQSRRFKNNQLLEQKRKALDTLPEERRVYAAAVDFPAQGNFKSTGGVSREVFVLNRGEVTQPREVAVPGLLPLSAQDNYQMAVDSTESERRAELARWLVDPSNPFVWRSIVNRVWQHHFGEGLVATPNDFGRMGAKPSHPELLDWLTRHFLQEGQSLKSLHRLIVSSRVYRQASRFDEQNAMIDSNNRYLWRMNRRRLSAEEIRDSILQASGVMDLTMGGPGFYLFDLEKTEHSPHFEYHSFDPKIESSHRRSIYRFVVRSQPDPWMTTLDCSDSSQSTPKRGETLTSLQALSLLNNNFNLEMASRFAQRLSSHATELEEQVDEAIAIVLQRRATVFEREQLTAYANEYGLENMCRLLFNLNEFVYVD